MTQNKVWKNEVATCFRKYDLVAKCEQCSAATKHTNTTKMCAGCSCHDCKQQLSYRSKLPSSRGHDLDPLLAHSQSHLLQQRPQPCFLFMFHCPFQCCLPCLIFSIPLAHQPSSSLEALRGSSSNHMDTSSTIGGSTSIIWPISVMTTAPHNRSKECVNLLLPVLSHCDLMAE